MIKFKKLQAVIWDMDGVILDSESLHFQALYKTLEKYNIPINDEILENSFGWTDQLVINSMTDGQLQKEEVERIRSEKNLLLQKTLIGQASYLPGVQKWLTLFKQNSILQALASSSSEAIINLILGELDAHQYFDEVVSGEKSVSKPDPFIFLKAAKKLGVKPLNCLVIEDAIAGVQAAKAAGMKCIAVTTSSPEESLDDADLVLDNLGEMASSHIQQLFSN